MIEKQFIQKRKPLLDTLSHRLSPTPPIWFMRQAGRYLPEYRQLRAQTKDFLSCCYTPAIASEITLQPLKRFNLDAAIIFSDILVIPNALGVNVSFEEHTGPKLATISSEADIKALQWKKETLDPVYEAIHRTSSALPSHVTLIGFAGAPWTLAAYMLEGKSTQQFTHARHWAYTHPTLFSELLTQLEHAIIDHITHQIHAGCEVIQIFDSWAGILNATEIAHWSIKPLERITYRLQALFPHVPIILFPRGVGAHYPEYAKACPTVTLSVDQHTSMPWLSGEVSCVLQGNLDPLLLASHLPNALDYASFLCHAMKGKPFIFNLGHGMLPSTPPEHVEALITHIKQHHD